VAETFEKSRGRLERRRLQTSTRLAQQTDWPHQHRRSHAKMHLENSTNTRHAGHIQKMSGPDG
jgi:hypothetical protein